MARRPSFTDDYYERRNIKPKRSRDKSKNVTKLDSFDLIDFFPKTENQENMFVDFHNGENILAIGSAGTGKTVCALYLALQKLITNGISKVIIVRSATPGRQQGFLPGSLAEKEEIYTQPYKQLVNFLFHNDIAWEVLVKKGFIEFVSTSYIRGITFDNAVIVFDEIQNADFSEITSLLTRLGESCRIILCGDIRQNDLSRRREVSGFNDALKLITHVPDCFSTIEFTRDDIVRSEFVKKIIIALEDLGM
jgi:phosphate starvation-inducible protein PhoH